ncbi:glycosyltransferase [Microbacterium sp. JZ31]|uniref:glycosyltransferase n=1 Tax=Microbacterium sp. JZ31 TaxID=1906274 RepID=UPI001932436E|nr:glycosyltransferase [Microbacterium sp. JZ31]
MADGSRKTLLILSYSKIATDPRVRRQIAVFKDRYDVITCGHGPTPEGVVRHIELPAEENANKWDGRVLALRQYRLELWRNVGVRGALRRLKGIRPDIILANEAIAVPVALKMKPRCGVHADLHEYHSRVREHEGYWKLRAKPWMEWMIRTYVTKADSWTTVGPGIAAEYEREFGFRPDVVRNAAPYVEGEPGETHWPPRIVHSGGAMRARGIHTMVEGVLAAENGATIDLYLVKSDPKYVAELQALADASGGRATLHEPLPYAELIQRLRTYDMGIHVLPPTNFNHRMALPNKIFDYLQARIGAVVGPSQEMVQLVESVGYGVSTEDFSAQAIARTVDALTKERIDRFKQAAAAGAKAHAAATDDAVWLRAITAIDDRCGAA